MSGDLLTANETAAELRCCRTTLYRLVHREELAEPVQIGGRSFWKKEDVEAAKARRGLRRPRRRRRQNDPAA